MSYKTIVLYLNATDRARRVIEVGAEIASRFEAHLIGLRVFPAVRLSPPLPLPFGREVASELREGIQRETADLKAIFEDMTARQPFVAEWRSVTDEAGDPCEIVLRQARAADLIVTSQADPSWPMSNVLDFPDSMVLGAGRPVLVVPAFGHHKGIPGNVSVAWRNTRESARAVADSLPLLKLATKVHVMSVEDAGTGADNGSLTEIANSLGRHGIKPVVSRPIATEFTTGEEIRVRAIDEQADMLVMGCYGHSRLREMALGGVTRHMLREMTIPILFSH